MNIRHSCFGLSLTGGLIYALVAAPATAHGQKPPAPGNSGAPTLNMPGPMGMQRGTALELTLTGTNLADPTGLLTSIPAKISFPTDNNNGKDPAKLRVKLETAPDAPLGFHSMRLATNRGISNLRLFCIDDLPQILAVDTNKSKTTAQPVPIPCLVAGKAEAEINHYFKISAKAGQRVSFEVLGRRLGSPFDPQITLLEPRMQKELAHNNDAPGLQTDPRLTYTFKEAGEYLVEIRDVMYRGGPDYWYRLRIGDFPCATTPIPMAAKRGSKVKVQFTGPAVADVTPVEVQVPADPGVDIVWVAPRGANGLYGWPVALAVSDLEELVEKEPNNELAKANRLPVPCGITGRFQEKGDVDHFVFAAKKGERWIIQAHTQEYYSPTDVYMVLKNPTGTQIAASNPAQDPRIDFTAPADGDFVLAVEHLNYWGGPDESYRITITPPEPGFDLALGADKVEIPQGGVAVLPIQTVTRRDYNGSIEVSVAGNSLIDGQTVINAGPPAPNQPAGSLFLTFSPGPLGGPSIGPQELIVQGKATINGKVVISRASVRTVLSQGLASLPLPPRNMFHQVAMAITEKAPATLALKLDQVEQIRGTAVSATVTATREAGFNEEITLTPLGFPPNVAAALKNIPKDQKEVKVQLTPAANSALGQFMISVTGKTKFQNREYTVTASPAKLNLILPFDLKVESVPLKIGLGEKGKIRVTAARKAGYQGPIALEVRNLPANVAAGKATIAMGQTEAEIEITAAPNAPFGDKADVNVVGTASTAGNQQNTSPNFAVSVIKK